MRVWIDTNVLIDFIAEREGFVEDAQLVLSLCDGVVDGYISVLSFANIAYIFRKSADASTLGYIKDQMCSVLHFADCIEGDIDKAIALNYSDFEDALQTAGAIRVGADCIVTRNKSDYKNSPIPVLTPRELAKTILL